MTIALDSGTTRKVQLDGLRCLSVVSVFLTHAAGRAVPGGWVGVDVFFVLSGYLITTLLLREEQRDGRINLKRFYLRRFLRIVPPLLIALVLYNLIWSGPREGALKSTLAALFFITNLFDPAPLQAFLVTWSLSLEEQFYLLWPMLLILLSGDRRRFRGPVVMAGMVFPLILRSIAHAVHPGSLRPYYLTPFRMDAISFGCALALFAPRAVRTRPETTQRLVRGGALVACVILLTIVLTADVPAALRYPLIFTAAATAACALIIALLLSPPESALVRFFSLAPMRYLGRRSYAIYLFHIPAIAFAERIGATSERVELAYTGRMLGAFVLTTALAELSWRLVEKPALDLSSRVAASNVSIDGVGRAPAVGT